MKKTLICAGMVLLLLVTVFAAQYFLTRYEPEREVKKERGRTVQNHIAPDTEYLEYYGLDAFETHLPVVHINTNGAVISKEEKIWSTIAVADAPADGSTRSIMDMPDYEADIQINYRGASSYSQFDKKQYRIKFFKKEGSTNAKNYPFLGMGENSEWVLNGPFLDKTMMRNRLVYGMGREVAEWAPDSRYMELFINGEYQGVYLALEPVTNGETRLRLCEFGLASGETAYIVKRDRVETEENPLEVYGHYAGKTNNDLYIDYPTQNNLTEEQRKWITKDIDRFENVLYGENFADPVNGYAKYIDVDSFVDYYILSEFVMNHDAGNLSTYIYKELGGKMQIAMWDYNNCFDNYQWFAMDYTAFYVRENAWFHVLLKDKAFVDRVVERYRELRKDTLSEEKLFASVDTYREELGPAIDRNYAIWGYSFYNKMLSDTNEMHVNPNNYEEAVTQLKNAIHVRGAFLDAHITDLYDGCAN